MTASFQRGQWLSSEVEMTCERAAPELFVGPLQQLWSQAGPSLVDALAEGMVESQPAQAQSSLQVPLAQA